MARNTKLVTIVDEGRDKGKGYLITEMPPFQGEKWATRLLLAAAEGGMEVPEGFDFKTASSAKLAPLVMLAIAKAKWETLEPLLDEMMGCVQYVPTPSNPLVILPLSANSEAIEEVKTLLTIRRGWLGLQLGFSMAESFPTSAQKESQ
jgi:hypothetical protein